ncbi:MAG: MBL fold metallo-hydrolase [Pseudomonadales bacterium]|nr:MBL fold metallo-hydrolase [Pseudomonadales bacterium]
MELEFYGAARHVTGSCHIVRANGRTVLLDCGLIQGGREDEARNSDAFPFAAADIDAVILSHAHLDHAGRLPLLAKRGFVGTVHTQNATRALMEILLNDAADIEMSVVRRENRYRSEHGRRLAEPLFLRDDVATALRLTRGHGYDTWFDVAEGIRARFHDAGHIMGSAVVEVDIAEAGERRTLVFTGDLGQYDSPILRDPVTPPRADLVLMETTYGDRNHRDRAASLEEFGEVIRTARRERGNVLIPAFAVGRSQEILYQLGKHFDAWELSHWRIFLDSPLGIEASEIYWDHAHLIEEDARRIFRGGEHMPALPNLHFTRTAAESKAINALKHGAIVIAGSGMCNGGRILHHFKRDLGKPNTHLIFTGYQPPGTLGRRIIDGADTVRIHGELYPVRARVHTIGGLSAHGDQQDLLRWYAGFENRPPAYLVHGDPEALEAFRRKLGDTSDAHVVVPHAGDRVDLARIAVGAGSPPSS